MSAELRAVVWDLGGVLVRTEDRAPRSAAAARCGQTYADLDRLVFNGASAVEAVHGRRLAPDHWRAVAAELGVGAADLPALQRDFWGGDRLDHDLIALIRSLRPRWQTALLSNHFSDLRQRLADEWAIADAFDVIVISAEVGLTKPDPAIFQLTLDRLGVAPAEAVFIDDFRENIAAAAALGWRTIHFQHAAQARADLLALLAA
jgi:FMN phosphatase YigB (HAD superfamily)